MFKLLKFDKRHALFGLGMGAAVLLILGAAEWYLRYFPPEELSPYLGESAPLSGIYRADKEFGVNYKSWEVFRQENRERLTPYLPHFQKENPPRLWAFFGNSFVQAHGMLADRARDQMPDRVIFKLGRNEPVPIRFAQIKMLLEHGLKPERIFLAFLPVDTHVIGRFPLETHYVTKTGALTYKPRLPSGTARGVVEHSNVALTAWVRANLHHGNQSYSFKDRFAPLDDVLRGDLERLFGSLAKTAKKHRVPVTIVLVPEFYQVARGAGFGFQNDVKKILRKLGLDAFDPREAFLRQPNPAALYLPDKHLNAEGNRLLLEELLRHLNTQAPQKPEA